MHKVVNDQSPSTCPSIKIVTAPQLYSQGCSDPKVTESWSISVVLKDESDVGCGAKGGGAEGAYGVEAL